MARTCELTVDLDAINRNLALVAHLAGDRAVLVAVKANAYGHGLVEVARSVEAAGAAQWLGVTTVPEAAALRAAGISLPILKFSITLADQLADALAAGVAFTVGDTDAITQLSEAAAARGVVAEVHLKIDTGMRRIGAEPEDALRLARLIVHDPHLRLGGIYTHLPVSDVGSGAEFTRQQLAAFEASALDVQAHVGHVPWIHAANSGAVMSHDLGATTMVRPGIMVYGSYSGPVSSRSAALEPVARWSSRLVFVKQVRAGESVGYGRTWTATQDTWVGTVAVGYGDGYSRLLSNCGRMLIDGQSHPIVGRVCMDQTMIDLGPATPTARVGDEVVLMGRSRGEEITVQEIADLMGTITYEVTCLITARVPRRHIGGVSRASTN
ncbi:MAG: alanine racemase [Propionibacteriaceae bacterium]|nr:alanine racemase [Propionibacteriaceae bacterium]